MKTPVFTFVRRICQQLAHLRRRRWGGCVGLEGRNEQLFFLSLHHQPPAALPTHGFATCQPTPPTHTRPCSPPTPPTYLCILAGLCLLQAHQQRIQLHTLDSHRLVSIVEQLPKALLEALGEVGQGCLVVGVGVECQQGGNRGQAHAGVLRGGKMLSGGQRWVGGWVRLGWTLDWLDKGYHIPTAANF